jgi:hypothetical protein
MTPGRALSMLTAEHPDLGHRQCSAGAGVIGGGRPQDRPPVPPPGRDLVPHLAQELAVGEVDRAVIAELARDQQGPGGDTGGLRKRSLNCLTL